jgi:hypothetical protein
MGLVKSDLPSQQEQLSESPVRELASSSEAQQPVSATEALQPTSTAEAQEEPKLDFLVESLDEVLFDEFSSQEEQARAMVGSAMRIAEALRSEYTSLLDGQEFNMMVSGILLQTALQISGPEAFVAMTDVMRMNLLPLLAADEPVEGTVTSLLSEEERQALLQRQQPQDEDQEPTAMRIALQRVQPQAEHRRGKGGK